MFACVCRCVCLCVCLCVCVCMCVCMFVCEVFVCCARRKKMEVRELGCLVSYLTMNSICKLTIFFRNMAIFAGNNKILLLRFPENSYLCNLLVN